jgi:hypothetical protein
MHALSTSGFLFSGANILLTVMHKGFSSHHDLACPGELFTST